MENCRCTLLRMGTLLKIFCHMCIFAVHNYNYRLPPKTKIGKNVLLVRYLIFFVRLQTALFSWLLSSINMILFDDKLNRHRFFFTNVRRDKFFRATLFCRRKNCSINIKVKRDECGWLIRMNYEQMPRALYFASTRGVNNKWTNHCRYFLYSQFRLSTIANVGCDRNLLKNFVWQKILSTKQIHTTKKRKRSVPRYCRCNFIPLILLTIHSFQRRIAYDN